MILRRFDSFVLLCGFRDGNSTGSNVLTDVLIGGTTSSEAGATGFDVTIGGLMIFWGEAWTPALEADRAGRGTWSFREL
jgi:hypothetical protein